MPVQFFHPGPEPDVTAEGRFQWNRGHHYRRFLEARGLYIERLDPSGNHPVQEGTIQFWGEWEADTVVSRIGNGRTGQGYPQFIHRTVVPTTTPQTKEGPSVCPPTCGNNDVGNNCGGYLNTDPCVFSDPNSPTVTFLYSNCYQDRFKSLTRLSCGDVVLFGSRKDGNFVLDTVFVVAKAYPYSPGDVRTNAAIRSVVPDWYYHLTLDLLPPNNNYVLYLGATIDNPVDGMFSFFPCSTPDRHPLGFPRPATLKQYSTNMGRGIRRRPLRETSKQLWQQAVDDVLRAGLYLGVRANV